MSLQGGISGTGEREITASNEPDRVPWMEGTGGYEIQSHFLGKTVTEADLKFQVEFWIHAGYDYVLLTVGMMTPGEITRKSSIVGVVQKAMRGTVLSMTTFIGTRHVFPAKAGILNDTGFRVKPGMTNSRKFMAWCIT